MAHSLAQIRADIEQSWAQHQLFPAATRLRCDGKAVPATVRAAGETAILQWLVDEGCLKRTLPEGSAVMQLDTPGLTFDGKKVNVGHGGVYRAQKQIIDQYIGVRDPWNHPPVHHTYTGPQYPPQPQKSHGIIGDVEGSLEGAYHTVAGSNVVKGVGSAVKTVAHDVTNPGEFARDAAKEIGGVFSEFLSGLTGGNFGIIAIAVVGGLAFIVTRN